MMGGGIAPFGDGRRSAWRAPETSLRRRLVVFSLLGPPLGMATLLMLAAVPAAAADAPAFDRAQLADALPVLLFLAYFMGVLPAFLAGLADHGFARAGIGRWWRVLAMAATGAILCLVPLLTGIAYGLYPARAILIFSTSGVVAGAACSAIAARLWRRAGLPPP